jgi:hypothetical protein
LISKINLAKASWNRSTPSKTMTHSKTDDAAGSGLSMVDVEKALISISDELVILQSQLVKLMAAALDELSQRKKR